jgi:hypothetical protein
VEALSLACGEGEDKEDEHPYPQQGVVEGILASSPRHGCRLPPPEEERNVRSAAGAAKAGQSRKKAIAGR